MKSNARIAAGIAIIILGLLVIITPRYLFPVCEEEDDSSMATSMGATATTDDMGTMQTTTGTMTDEMDGMDMGTTTGSTGADMDNMDMSGDTDMNMDDETDADMDMSSGHAACYYTSRGALMLGLLIMLGGAAMMLATSADAVRLLSLVLGGMGAVVILTPTYFLPICENPQMACHDGSEPLLIVLGGLLILIVAVLAAMANGRQQGQE